MDEAGELAEGLRQAVAGIAAAAPFLADWPEGPARRAQVPGLLPVCRWLPDLAGGPLVAALRRAAPRLEWRQTYGAADFGTAFLERYGWTELVGLRGPIPSDRVAAGVLMLGPGVTYPAHSHQAAELYLPLAGTALWQKGDAPFALVAPGTPILHDPWVPHAMQTGTEPLLALYLWRGGDLAAKSRIH